MSIHHSKDQQLPEVESALRDMFPAIYEQEARSAIVQASHLVELQAGDIFMDLGGYIKSIPLVLSGLLKLIREDEQGNEILLYFVAPGETCAMSLTCCNSDARSTIRVSAEEDTVLLAVPARNMDEWTERFRSWKTFVMQSYQNRFEALLRTIDSIAFQKLDQRLLKLLREHARTQGSEMLQITHQELANELNSSREVVSRLLKVMEHDGLVELGRQRIKVLTP